MEILITYYLIFKEAKRIHDAKTTTALFSYAMEV